MGWFEWPIVVVIVVAAALGVLAGLVGWWKAAGGASLAGRWLGGLSLFASVGLYGPLGVLALYTATPFATLGIFAGAGILRSALESRERGRLWLGVAFLLVGAGGLLYGVIWLVFFE